MRALNGLKRASGLLDDLLCCILTSSSTLIVFTEADSRLEISTARTSLTSRPQFPHCVAV